MAMQSPIGNPPAAGTVPGTTWAPVSTVTLPMSGAPAGADPLMTELPDVPPPPFINYHPGATAPSPPTPQAPATTAQSLPVVEIPPPHMAAPWVFTRIPKPPPPQIIHDPAPPAPPQIPPPVMQQPPPPPQQQQAPQPPQGQQPDPNQNNQNQQQQPPQQQQSQVPQRMPTEPVDLSPLNDDVIRSLNKQLNNVDNDDERANASMTFFKILNKNPYLAEDPVYRPYVDAFMQKILRDPSPVVRVGAELALHLGKVKNPPPAVVAELETLSTPRSKYDFEAGTVSGILENARGANIIQDNSAMQQQGQGQGGQVGGQGQSGPGMNNAQQISSRGPAQGGGSQPDPSQMQGGGEQTPDPAQMAQMMQALSSNQGGGADPTQMLQGMGSQAGAANGGQNPDPNQMAQLIQALMVQQGGGAPPGAIPGGRLNTVSRSQPGGSPAQAGAMPGQRLNMREGR